MSTYVAVTLLLVSMLWTSQAASPPALHDGVSAHLQPFRDKLLALLE